MNNGIFKPGQSVFIGISDIKEKKTLLTGIEEAMTGDAGKLLHPIQKAKFSTDIQNQILLEIDQQGDVYFICSLIDVLVDFWPDDALFVFQKIDPQGNKTLINKINLAKYRISGKR